MRPSARILPFGPVSLRHLAWPNVRMGGQRSFAADIMEVAGVRTSDVGCFSMVEGR